MSINSALHGVMGHIEGTLSTFLSEDGQKIAPGFHGLSAALLPKIHRHFQAIYGRVRSRLNDTPTPFFPAFHNLEAFPYIDQDALDYDKAKRPYLLESAETPGRSLPSKSSNEAPPPVET